MRERGIKEWAVGLKSSIIDFIFYCMQKCDCFDQNVEIETIIITFGRINAGNTKDVGILYGN